MSDTPLHGLLCLGLVRFLDPASVCSIVMLLLRQKSPKGVRLSSEADAVGRIFIVMHVGARRTKERWQDATASLSGFGVLGDDSPRTR